MCDTLVALNSATSGNFTIFGKNSDRPENEVQLVVYIPHKMNNFESKLKCTYISIPQVEETASLLLSQPYWMWGAEMGVNEHGVAIGNEAVWTNQPYKETGLLGMDLVRLGLERGLSAEDSTRIIIKLLEEFGQGGRCSFDGSMIYHNSFLIVDYKEAWVLETAGEWWVAEKITKGIRNISNGLTINNKGTIQKEGLIDYAIDNRMCNDENDFNFAKNFSESWSDIESRYSRQGMCKYLLKKKENQINLNYISEILREHESGICMHGGFTSSGSQISLLGENNRNVSFFTATNNPCKSTYHPFDFSMKNVGLTDSGPYKEIDENWIWKKYDTEERNNENISKLMNNEKKQFDLVENTKFSELNILDLNKISWEYF